MEHGILRRGAVKRDGVILAEWIIDLPDCGEYAFIGSFYEGIAEGVEREFCQGALKERAEREYEQSTDVLKRFRFPAFRYFLRGQRCYEDGRLYSVRLDATLRRKGESEFMLSGIDVHTWDLATEMLLPPDVVALEMGVPPMTVRERKRAKSALVTQGRILLYDGKCLYERDKE